VERLCRYLLRPPLALERLTESSDGQLLSALLLDPLELLEPLAALGPAPRRAVASLPWPPRAACGLAISHRVGPRGRCGRALRGGGPGWASAARPAVVGGVSPPRPSAGSAPRHPGERLRVSPGQPPRPRRRRSARCWPAISAAAQLRAHRRGIQAAARAWPARPR
jgi:hypothetical protein